VTTATTPVVNDEQAVILALHAHVVQGGFSTPEIERERLLKDAEHSDDPQKFIDETVGKFAFEVMQAQLARQPQPEPQPEPAESKLGSDSFEWMGEVLELDPATGWELLAEYRAAAAQLHEAKARAKAIELRIMQTVQGYEHASINGQQVIHWPWVDSTSFDAKAFKEAGEEYRRLYEYFLKTKKTRRFKVDGTVGVD
jgi:predicted phage-related endonuclease